MSVVYVSPEDKVVSEVNPFLTPVKHVKPIQKSSNLIARLGLSIPADEGNCEESSEDIKYDSDGDLVVPRRAMDQCSLKESAILIEYENSTSISLVGLQVWRGAFLIGDFIIHFKEKYFKNKTVLEVGTGTGLGSIVAAHYANKVIATDINDTSILSLIEANLTHNKEFVKSQVVIKPLDFMELQWSTDLEQLVSSSDVILAADVVYHVDITNAFIETLKKILSTGTRRKDIFIAMEKRYIFTISDLDTMSPMYTHFLDELEARLGISPGCLSLRLPGTNSLISLNFIEKDFPQYFNYDRTKELVLLHLISSPC